MQRRTMDDTRFRSLNSSQIETRLPRVRVVLLGASNLSIMFPHVVETLRQTLTNPLEVYVAKGFGRSYGKESEFFGKKFPGILQCGLWRAIERAAPLPTMAIVADVGNDLAYETPVDRLVEWIEQTLDRLAGHDAHVVLNNIPIDALRRVGRVRYHAFRELFFPRCSIPRREMMSRAEQLSDALEGLAARRRMPVFSGKSEWYRLDPIHPRLVAAGEIWRRMIGDLTAPGAVVELRRAPASHALRLRRLRPEACSHFGVPRRATQPAARLADGTTIALY